MGFLLPTESGIYIFKNKINGKVYIGQSVNIRSRVHRHLSYLNKATKFKGVIYLALKKYGLEAFDIEVLELCSIDQLNEREEYWIKYYDSVNPDLGYNICSKSRTTLGTKRTDEQRKNFSRAAKQRVKDYGNPMQGKTHTKEVRDKLSQMMKDRFKNPEWKERFLNSMKNAKKTVSICAKTTTVLNLDDGSMHYFDSFRQALNFMGWECKGDKKSGIVTRNFFIIYGRYEYDFCKNRSEEIKNRKRKSL